ncbi:hypothetical protein HYR54_09180 [Candidatus Acetothermia bacterium]|nr:hypothetical protein [Candidatus Acetothermia bacterium]
MTTKHKRNHADSGIKWIHVKAQGLIGFQTIVVWAGETVEQFKQLLGLHPETMVTVPTVALPLHDGVSLFDYVKNFDTVLLEA